MPGGGAAVITFAPALHGWGGWTGPRRATRLAEAASRTWVLWPAEEVSTPPARFDPDDLLRVTGVDADSSREIEWQRIRGGVAVQRPSMAYELRDAVLSRGCVYTRRWRHALLPAAAPLWARVAETESQTSLLTATFNGSRYFGHWLMDELTRLLAAPVIGAPVAPPRPLSAHQAQYLRTLGLQQHERTDLRFRSLVILDERNQNAYRRMRYGILRERARQGRGDAAHAGVMLLRKDTGVARRMLNEDALAQRLAARGFRCLSPMEHPVDEILDACSGARVVVGVEGSHLTHALLALPPDATLVTLQPPQRFNHILKTYCDGIGLRYAFTVGHAQEQGFRVDEDGLERLLDSL